ncbi:allene oxide synthase-like [Gossypium australe]|uniref:Allene oxide synthase-like n=1 Tax=Gossypium australe TaxID=47621 RepID=A0A5B6W586_9ROSI|nr:allene oxide synthase-like [Gossypium australe]
MASSATLSSRRANVQVRPSVTVSELEKPELPLKSIPGDYGLPFIDRVLPEFKACYTELFKTVEYELAEKGKCSFQTPSEQAAFNFLARAFFDSNPVDSKLGTVGPSSANIWVLFQLGPIFTLGLPKYIEDLLLHTFPLPSFLVKKDYKKLYDFFYESAGLVLDEAEKMGISRDEACHNLVFATCFNSFGGIKVFFPIMLKWIGLAGENLHLSLAKEIRSVIKSNGGELSLSAMEQMPLMKSVVYESFRIDPPGKAKKDLLVESHDAVYEVKEGEMLFGYQPFATKDPNIFERAEEFVPDRFMGVDGEKLLKYVLWSNGPETEHPTVADKQCAGKDFVMLVSRLFVVEFFRRYDTFEVEVGPAPVGVAVTITSLKAASF